VSDELKIEVMYLVEFEMKPVAFPAAATSTIVTLINCLDASRKLKERK
jgi:hypothetical protein